MEIKHYSVAELNTLSADPTQISSCNFSPAASEEVGYYD